MKKTLTLFFIIISYSIHSQVSIETNINLANKTRSYAVPVDDKFVSTRFFLGLDFSLYYSHNKYQYGLEYFPYKHTNAFFGYEIYNALDSNFKIIPNIKYGYSFDLKKQYTGLGVKFQYKKINFSYHKILHFKSGDSKHWGDGLNCFSIGYRFTLIKK